MLVRLKNFKNPYCVPSRTNMLEGNMHSLTKPHFLNQESGGFYWKEGQ
jgi:hypothetical protein